MEKVGCCSCVFGTWLNTGGSIGSGFDLLKILIGFGVFTVSFTGICRFDTLKVGIVLIDVTIGSCTFSFLFNKRSLCILFVVNKLSFRMPISFLSKLVGLSVKLLDDDEGGEYGGCES